MTRKHSLHKHIDVSFEITLSVIRFVLYKDKELLKQK